MSQSGNLTFYAVSQLKDSRQSLQLLVSYLQPTSIAIIARGCDEERSWANYLAGRDDPEDEVLPSLAGASGLDEYYRDGVRLLARLDGSSIGLTIGRAVEAKIPKGIRGDFAPWDPVIQIGWHDLWECAEHDEGLFIARAFLSIGFFGYFTPNDWNAFRRLVFELPEVHVVKMDLQNVIGVSFEEVVYWSV